MKIVQKKPGKEFAAITFGANPIMLPRLTGSTRALVLSCTEPPLLCSTDTLGHTRLLVDDVGGYVLVLLFFFFACGSWTRPRARSKNQLTRPLAPLLPLEPRLNSPPVSCLSPSLIFFRAQGADNARHETEENPLHSYAKYIVSVLPKFVQQTYVSRNELTVCVAPDHVIPVMTCVFFFF